MVRTSLDPAPPDPGRNTAGLVRGVDGDGNAAGGIVGGGSVPGAGHACVVGPIRGG